MVTWVGKEERIEVETRIFIEVPDKSFSESADDLLTAASRLDFFFCSDILSPEKNNLMAESGE